MDGEDKAAETPLAEAPVATPTTPTDATQVATPQLPGTVDNEERELVEVLPEWIPGEGMAELLAMCKYLHLIS